MYSVLFIIFVFVMSMTSVSAYADNDGWYFGSETGLSLLPKQKFNNLNNSFSVDSSPGFSIFGQMGYQFYDYRLESEVSWRSNTIRSFTFNSLSHNGTGSIQPLNLLFNGYYDIKTGSSFTPYVGAGIGGARISANSIGYNSKIYIDNDQFVPAYQGIAGVSYAIDSHLSLKADYRYFRAPNARFSEIGLGSASSDYANHSVQLGFTYKFGASSNPPSEVKTVSAAVLPPVPSTVPATPVSNAPQKEFTIFFDFDKSIVTPEGLKTISNVTTVIKDSKNASITLIGQADRAGTPEYNYKLSLKRAKAVREQLVKSGVSSSIINVIGKGNNDLPIMTAYGVKELQNRRVLIQIN